MAQQVLVRVYQNLHRVEKPHGFLGYVSDLRHEVIDYFRRKGKIDQVEGRRYHGSSTTTAMMMGWTISKGQTSSWKADVEAAEEELICMIYECMPKKKWRRAHAW